MYTENVIKEIRKKYQARVTSICDLLGEKLPEVGK